MTFNASKTMIAVFAFLGGVVVSSIFPCESSFLLNSPASYFQYELEPTSYDALRFHVLTMMMNELGLLNALAELEEDELSEFIEQRKVSAERDRESAYETLAQVEKLLNEGGRLYKYSKDAQSGVLVLKDGKIEHKLPF